MERTAVAVRRRGRKGSARGGTTRRTPQQGVAVQPRERATKSHRLAPDGAPRCCRKGAWPHCRDQGKRAKWQGMACHA